MKHIDHLLQPSETRENHTPLSHPKGYARATIIPAANRWNNPQGMDIANYAKNDWPRIPDRGLYTEEARLNRLNFIRQHCKETLEHVGNSRLDPERLTNNIEHQFGSIEIPVGLAGPLLINGQYAKGLYYAPIATTEGTLVASMSRGARALSLSGGTNVRVLAQRMIRAPFFRLIDFDAAIFFVDWVKAHLGRIQSEIRKHSDYADLIEIDPMILGRKVHLRFIYETGDAAGQNMTTHCTNETCFWILEEIKRIKGAIVQEFWLEANGSADKKVTFQTFMQGRGIRVQAEAFLPNDIISSVLKVDPRKLYDLYKEAVVSSMQVGSLGMNINVANTIASIFVATGQDIACVHESSLAQLVIEKSEGGLYTYMLLPGLVIGTVGGGTGVLGGQSDCLKIIDCHGEGKVRKLAEIIASFALALDLSTCAAVASQQFAYSHQRLGRNKPDIHLQKKEINPDFIGAILRRTLQNRTILVHAAKPIPVVLGSSIITKLASDKTDKLLGHAGYRLELAGDGERKEVDVLIKIKPTDVEVIRLMTSFAGNCNAALGAEWKKVAEQTEFHKCHIREIEVYKQKDIRFTNHVPKIYGLHRNDRREAYVLIQELLKDMRLMDSADDVSGWREKHIQSAIAGLSAIHAIWYKKETELAETKWVDRFPTVHQANGLRSLRHLLAENAHDEFPRWIDQAALGHLRELIESTPTWWASIAAMPKTLIHNDFNPRNIAFRKADLRVCIYDWELAKIHLPQYDLVELLSFVLSEDLGVEQILHYAELQRAMLQECVGESIDREEWLAGLRYCAWDFYTYRFLMYIMGHTLREFKFLNRVAPTIKKIVNVL